MRGWFYTIFGGLLSGLVGFVPGAVILTALKMAMGVGLIGFVSWGSVAVTNWWHSDKITIAQSDQRCADAISVATLNAKMAAVSSREFLLRSREERVASDEEAVSAVVRQMEKDRAETARSGGDGVLVPSDDEWLQRYRARHTAQRGRR